MPQNQNHTNGPYLKEIWKELNISCDYSKLLVFPNAFSIAFSTVSLVSAAPDMASTFRDCSSQTASAIYFACAM